MFYVVQSKKKEINILK